jgi:hypothetical protein
MVLLEELHQLPCWPDGQFADFFSTAEIPNVQLRTGKKKEKRKKRE